MTKWWYFSNNDVTAESSRFALQAFLPCDMQRHWLRVPSRLFERLLCLQRCFELNLEQLFSACHRAGDNKKTAETEDITCKRTPYLYWCVTLLHGGHYSCMMFWQLCCTQQKTFCKMVQAQVMRLYCSAGDIWKCFVPRRMGQVVMCGEQDCCAGYNECELLTKS